MKKNSDTFRKVEINSVENKEIWNNILDSIIDYLVENTYKEEEGDWINDIKYMLK